MLEVESHSDGALLEVRASGQVSRADYETVLIPAFEAALKHHDRIRLLVVFTAGFEKFDLAAAWADFELGVSHWTGFDRLAVVTDTGWLGTGIRLMAPVMPCPVQVFARSDLDAARRWIRESLGSVHIQPLTGGGIQVQLLGKLDPEAIARAEATLDAHIRAQSGLRLLLDLTGFDGWQSLSAIGAHFKLVRGHAPQASRIAIIGDKTWQHAAQRMMRHVLNADTEFFEPDRKPEAITWLQST